MDTKKPCSLEQGLARKLRLLRVGRSADIRYGKSRRRRSGWSRRSCRRSWTVFVDLGQDIVGNVVGRIGVKDSGNAEQRRAGFIDRERGTFALGNIDYARGDLR